MSVVCSLLLVLSIHSGLQEERALERFVWNVVNVALPSDDLPAMADSGVDGWTIESLAADEVHVVNFFATWCRPCEEEMGQLRTLSEKVGVDVLGVIVRDEAVNVAAWLKRHGNPYRGIVSDWDHLWFDQMKIRGLPETFLVVNGVATHHWVGPITDDAIEMLEEITKGRRSR